MVTTLAKKELFQRGSYVVSGQLYFQAGVYTVILIDNSHNQRNRISTHKTEVETWEQATSLAQKMGEGECNETNT